MLGELVLALEDWRPPVEVYQVGFKKIAGLNFEPQPIESEFLNLKLITVFPNVRQGLYLEKIECQYLQAEKYGDLTCARDLEMFIVGACDKWLPDQWFLDFVDDKICTGKTEAECNLKMKREEYKKAQKENNLRRKENKLLKGMGGFKEVDEDPVDTTAPAVLIDVQFLPDPVSAPAPANTAADLMNAMADAWSEEFYFADADDFDF